MLYFQHLLTGFSIVETHIRTQKAIICKLDFHRIAYYQASANENQRKRESQPEGETTRKKERARKKA